MEEEPAFSIGEEAANPSNDVPMYTLGPQGSGKLGRINVVKAAFDVEEEGGDLEVEELKEADLVGEGRSGVERGKAGEGAGLVGMEEGARPGQEGEAGGGDAFHNLGKSLEEDDDPEGGRRIIRGLAWLVQDDAVGLL